MPPFILYSNRHGLGVCPLLRCLLGVLPGLGYGILDHLRFRLPLLHRHLLLHHPLLLLLLALVLLLQIGFGVAGAGIVPFPRVCGGDPKLAKDGVDPEDFSPRMRG